MSTGDSNEGDTIDRRNFLKKAAVGAGLAGAATGSFAASARADDKRIDPPVTRSEAHLQFEDAPIKEFAFPAQGAELFAKVCKEEGLAALFCCPGNYSIVSAMANAGIPTYGGRTEGPMCSAADGFIRVTGEVAAAAGSGDAATKEHHDQRTAAIAPAFATPARRGGEGARGGGEAVSVPVLRPQPLCASGAAGALDGGHQR